tara:strand:+ start:498 stop:872 length:375 start_codon:yes stop_codon:yes gene_type:complete
MVEITNEQCLEEIRGLTNDFDSRVNMDSNFIDSLKITLAQPGNSFRGEMDAPTNEIITKKVIGRGGYYFHLTTKNTGIYFIWHSRDTGKFIFWGSEYNVKQAMGVIRYRNKIVAQRELESVPKY